MIVETRDLKGIDVIFQHLDNVTQVWFSIIWYPHYHGLIFQMLELSNTKQIISKHVADVISPNTIILNIDISLLNLVMSNETLLKFQWRQKYIYLENQSIYQYPWNEEEFGFILEWNIVGLATFVCWCLVLDPPKPTC